MTSASSAPWPRSRVGFQEVAEPVLTDSPPIQSLRHARQLLRADATLTALFGRLFELRRREPSDDVVSRIVAAEGEDVRPEEMQPLVTLLLIAGFETTVNLIGNGVLAFSANPAQWEALRADPADVAPHAVEEALRYDPPVQRTARLAQQDTEVHEAVAPHCRRRAERYAPRRVQDHSPWSCTTRKMQNRVLSGHAPGRRWRPWWPR